MKYMTNFIVLLLFLTFVGCRVFWDDSPNLGDSCDSEKDCWGGSICRDGKCVLPEQLDGDKESQPDGDNESQPDGDKEETPDGDDQNPDGDLVPTDGDRHTDEDDDSNVDGDTQVPDGDSENPHSCSLLSGTYQGNYTCPDDEWEGDFTVSVDPTNCNITITGGTLVLIGTISKTDVDITKGKTCTGHTSDDIVFSLDCSDNCQFSFVLKSALVGQGELQLSAEFLDYGAPHFGTTVTKKVTLTNIANSDLKIPLGGIYLEPSSNSKFEISNQPSLPLVMTQDSSLDIPIKFTANGDECARYSNTLYIATDSTITPLGVVQLFTSPKCSVPIVETDPAALSFGECSLGNRNVKSFFVVNRGAVTAKVKTIFFNNDQNGAFTFDSPPNSDFDLEKYSSRTVEVAFKPIEGVHSVGSILVGSVTINWLDIDQQIKSTYMELVGKVVEPAPPCLDITPQDGKIGFAGMGEFPGPGINFGYRPTGVQHVEKVTMRNCGDLPVTLDTFVWQNSMFDQPPMETRAFAESPGVFKSYVLQKNETVEIPITFSPRADGILYASAFSFLSNAAKYTWFPDGKTPDPSTPINVGLMGHGGSQALIISPSNIDFNKVTKDCSSSRKTVTISNYGAIELSISKIQIGAGSDETFTLFDLPTLPVTLVNSDISSISFDVNFHASTEGPHNGRIEISGGSEEQILFSLPLKGEGISTAHQIDSFAQPSIPKVDILFMVDCSGSMTEEQEKLATNMDAFINNLVSWNADYHLGVIASDMESEAMSGRLQGNPKYLYNKGSGALSTSEIINSFKTRVMLGTGCSSYEKGLEAMLLALSEPLISNENAGFLRDDAKLILVWLSDEEDQSSWAAQGYAEFFVNLKMPYGINRPNGFAIVGDKGKGCQGATADESADAGDRYIAVADILNPEDDKHFLSICKSDYSDFNSWMSESVFKLNGQFLLSRVPDPSTISVKIGNTVSPLSDWTYNEFSNSILFAEGKEPSPGASISIEYNTLCLSK